MTEIFATVFIKLLYVYVHYSFYLGLITSIALTFCLVFRQKDYIFLALSLLVMIGFFHATGMHFLAPFVSYNMYFDHEIWSEYIMKWCLGAVIGGIVSYFFFKLMRHVLAKISKKITDIKYKIDLKKHQKRNEKMYQEQQKANQNAQMHFDDFEDDDEDEYYDEDEEIFEHVVVTKIEKKKPNPFEMEFDFDK